MKNLYEELEVLESKKHKRMNKELARLNKIIENQGMGLGLELSDQQHAELIIERHNLHIKVRKLKSYLLIENQELIDKQPKDIRYRYYYKLNEAYDIYYTGTYAEKYEEAKKDRENELVLYLLCELMHIELIKSVRCEGYTRHMCDQIKKILVNPHNPKNGRDPLK